MIFVPEKYVARGSPVFARKRSCPPSAANRSTMSCWRVSCQTNALWTALPVVRSQTTVVSRWFVMPTAARSDPERPDFCNAPSMTSWLRVQISAGSCSTQPGFGKICSCSFWSTPITAPPWSKIMNRVLVVP